MKPVFIDIKEFDYPLPDEKIAKYPLEKRSASKLLFCNKGLIEHRRFDELPDLLPPHSLLVFNNTKVIEARLKFKKETGAEIELFLLNPALHQNATNVLKTKGKSIWQCMVGNKKRWKEEDVLELSTKDFTIRATWKDREKDLVEFDFPTNHSLEQTIHELGSLPIPPYLNRPTEEIDITRYQTNFAQYNGSVAAPTAALHFDDIVLEKLKQKNILSKYLTLHVGAGTFKPVSAENAIDHLMHEEYIIYSRDFIESLTTHQGPVIAVGTTSLRSLESLYWYGVGLIKGLLDHFHIEQYFPYQFETNTITVEESLTAIIELMNKKGLATLEGTSSIYIVPGYIPKMVKGIVTNFHQPQSTLLLLIASLVGNDWKTIYEEALKNEYRFLSYGDSSLLLF